VQGTSDLGVGVQGSGLYAGVSGTGSDFGPGVIGITLGYDQPGVLGSDESSYGAIGVQGTSDFGTGVLGLTEGDGQSAVLGQDQSPGGGIGVQGFSNSGGTGVQGTCHFGTGVQATSTAGTALAVAGKVTFSSSGKVTVPANQNSMTVHQPGVSPTSLVLATLQQVQGSAAVAAAVPGTNSFTITLTSAANGPLQVAWFVIG
jgi:hypothetical protein